MLSNALLYRMTNHSAEACSDPNAQRYLLPSKSDTLFTLVTKSFEPQIQVLKRDQQTQPRRF